MTLFEKGYYTMKTEFTSTIESTVISAEMFNKVNKKSFPFVFKLNGIMTADEAEEAVEKLVKGGKAVLEMNKLDKDGKAVLDKDGKAVKESVKISDCRLAYVDGLEVESAYYEMGVNSFIQLCNRFGTVKEMTADEYKAYIKAREEAKAAREAEKAAREAEKDSNKGSASN